MQFDSFTIPALFLLGMTTLSLIFFRDWRITISALGVQYIGVFILVGVTWPLEMAVIKLITGWIASAVVGMGLVSLPTENTKPERKPTSGQLFNLILVVMVVSTILSFGPWVAKWLIQASYEQIIGGLLLVGMGLLHLGVSSHPVSVTIGLLTFVSGFEIIYATLDASPVAAGFLSIIALGIALTGSYLILAPNMEREK